MSLLAATRIPDSRLLEKHGAAITSEIDYPPVDRYDPAFDGDDLRRMWQLQQPANAPLALHLRMPICRRSRCRGCQHCPSISADQCLRDWLEPLKREIALQAQLVGRQRPVTEMYWGGGAPTRLPAPELTELLHWIASHFQLLDHDAREYTIEIDPAGADQLTLALLRGLGFNRLMLGVDDFEPEVLAAIGREQTPEQVAQLAQAARSFGFPTLGIELLYGLPRQSPASLCQTLHRAIELQPERILIADVHHRPGRVPAHLLAPQPMPEGSTGLQARLLIAAELEAAGYQPIGTELWVRAADELAQAQRLGQLRRTLLGFSAAPAQDQLGFGPGARSGCADAVARNLEPRRYREALQQGRLPVADGLWLSRDQQIRRQLLGDLLCHLRIDPAPLEQRLGIHFESWFARELQQLGPLLAEGLLQRKGRCLELAATGRPLLGALFQLFSRE